MKKIISLLLSFVILASSFAFNGVSTFASTRKNAPEYKVGDTFTYGDFVLTVEGIAEGSEGFDEAGTPEGKFVTISFSAELTSDEGSFGAEKSSFAIDGKEAVDATATMHLENGAMTPGGIVALFDVDADADPDYLHLVVSN